MERYAVYAGDQMYGGLHGMCEHCVVDAKDSFEAKDIAIIKANEVIESYSNIYESIDETVEDYAEEGMTEDDLAELRQDIVNDDLDWSIWKIDESKAEDISTDLLDQMYYNDPEGFIEEYCIEI